MVRRSALNARVLMRCWEGAGAVRPRVHAALRTCLAEAVSGSYLTL